MKQSLGSHPHSSSVLKRALNALVLVTNAAGAEKSNSLSESCRNCRYTTLCYSYFEVKVQSYHFVLFLGCYV